jgi:hypothetical protein
MIALSSREERKAKAEGENRVKRRASAKGASSRFGRHRPFLFSFSTLGLFNLDREKKLITPFEKKKQKRKKPNIRTSYQLAPEDELNWDDGTANPEYCVDRWDDVGKYQALKWLLGGLGVFGGALTLASVLDKRSEIPFAPREYPFDSLKKELNGSKGVGPRD